MRKICFAMLFLALASASALAASVNGKWTAVFNTQAGVQKYTYELHVNGTQLTGKAISQYGNVEIKDGKIDGDNVSFVEVLKHGDQNLKITYTGKVEGNEIKFTRVVGGKFKEKLVAMRAK